MAEAAGPHGARLVRVRVPARLCVRVSAWPGLACTIRIADLP